VCRDGDVEIENRISFTVLFPDSKAASAPNDGGFKSHAEFWDFVLESQGTGE